MVRCELYALSTVCDNNGYNDDDHVVNSDGNGRESDGDRTGQDRTGQYQ